MIRAVRLSAMAAAALLSVSACGLVDRAEREVEDAASSGIERAIGDRVQRELKRAGIELEGRLDCDSDVDLKDLQDGVDGTVTCSGRTRDGDPVEASFDGTLSANGTCRGTVIVTVAGKEQVHTPETNICAQQ